MCTKTKITFQVVEDTLVLTDERLRGCTVIMVNSVKRRLIIKYNMRG